MATHATTSASPLIRLHANDNVLIAREPIAIGQQLPEFGLRMRAQVPAGHKIAARDIAAGEPVRKYDTVIGAAMRDISAGEHVHSHNIELIDFDRDPGFCEDVRPVDYVPEDQRATFMGIVRPDGRVATRNFIGILSSVNCSSTASTSRPSGWRTTPTSTASSRLRRPAAAACRRRAITSMCCAARSPATRPTPTSPAR